MDEGIHSVAMPSGLTVISGSGSQSVLFPNPAGTFVVRKTDERGVEVSYKRMHPAGNESRDLNHGYMSRMHACR